MTIADLDEMERALARRLLPWISKATKRIVSGINDAEAHAEKVLTDALRKTDDGPRTARRFRRSPSYAAALARLDSLQAALIGPKVDSLDGMVRDARAAFYADSIKLWMPHVPAKYRIVPDPAPTVDGERMMRSAIIHGYDLQREFEPVVQHAKDQLYVAMNQSSRKGLSDNDGAKRIWLWASDARDRLVRKASQVLSDSDKAIHEATGWLMIKPEYRGERTLTTGGISF